MSREIVLLPHVSSDFVEGFDYYEALSPGRGGARFEAAFRDAVQLIASGVTSHVVVFDRFHRVMLRRFPYNLYYREIADKAIITALLYARFDPRRIERTLKHRGD
ncbi:MAG: recombinase [Verrucomicrobiales bacterium]|nr:recombinase [Verrucomicrobiales bacterium]